MNTGATIVEPDPPGQGWTSPVDDLIDVLFYLATSAQDAVEAAGNRPRWLEALESARRLHALHKARDAEETCHRCGRDYTPWSAMSPLWNEVMRGGDINAGPEPYLGMVCCDCFIKLAEQAGVATDWRLHAGQVFRQLKLTTPTGRVWSDQRWLFEPPGGQQIVGSNVGGQLVQISAVAGDVNL